MAKPTKRPASGKPPAVAAAPATDRNGQLMHGARGGSAGGYTTLAALAFHDTFKAGASYYGVSGLEVLARGTRNACKAAAIA